MLWRARREAILSGLRKFYHIQNLIKGYQPAEPHYYLHAIGVREDKRGKGIGSALLRSILTRCDSEKANAYLESSKERNLDFYESHGFKVIGKEYIANDGPPIWFMLRQYSKSE